MEKTKKIKLPHVYVLLFVVMLFVLLITYIVPSGEFARVIDPNSGREIINPETYTVIEKTGLTGMDFFIAIHTGFTETRDIIALLLFVAGTLAVIEKTGAIGAGINAIVKKTKGMDTMLLIFLTTLFSFLGGIGFAEGGTPFVPLAVTLAVALGYDKIIGAGAAILGLGVGFTSGFLNINTTGIGQSIVGLPLYSGMGFRLVAWVILTAIASLYVVMHAKKSKSSPSMMQPGNTIPEDDGEIDKENSSSLTTARLLILLAFGITIAFQIYGTLKLGWYIPQLTAIYLMLAVAVGIISRMGASEIAIEISKGASAILPAALAIGLARSVLVLMNQGKILDTAIHSLAGVLDGKSPLLIVILVYFVVVVFNFFVTSGSGKAVILMPILGPLGQITGINQQVMVIAYQMGDGFTNYFWPTAGTLMAALALGKVEYEDWFKFSYKFFIIITIVGALLTVAAQLINLGPF